LRKPSELSLRLKVIVDGRIKRSCVREQRRLQSVKHKAHMTKNFLLQDEVPAIQMHEAAMAMAYEWLYRMEDHVDVCSGRCS
jgi:hypothetical protein